MTSNNFMNKNDNKTKEQFNQSSFINSSQDTPKILQRSKNYYNNESYSEENSNSKQQKSFQKNTPPKH